MWFSLVNRGIRVFCHLREMQVTRRGCSKYVFVLLVFLTVTMMAAGHGYMQELCNWFFCSSALNTPVVCIFMLTMVAKHQRLSKKDAVWKAKNSRLCVKPDIHSYPQFLTRIVTASVIFPSTSVCTGVCQHTVSGTMTKMAAYSKLDWSNKKWSVGHQGLCSCTTSLVHRLKHSIWIFTECTTCWSPRVPRTA